MASVLSVLENLGEDKHVESILLPCLDEGSIPSWSTFEDKEMMFDAEVGIVSFFVMWQSYSQEEGRGTEIVGHILWRIQNKLYFCVANAEGKASAWVWILQNRKQE